MCTLFANLYMLLMCGPHTVCTTWGTHTIYIYIYILYMPRARGMAAYVRDGYGAFR